MLDQYRVKARWEKKIDAGNDSPFKRNISLIGHAGHLLQRKLWAGDVPIVEVLGAGVEPGHFAKERFESRLNAGTDRATQYARFQLSSQRQFNIPASCVRT